MGLESANYKLLVKNWDRDGLVETLLKFPKMSERRSQAEGFLEFEMKTEEFLIEFQLFPEKEGKLQTLSIRIALCNPETVLYELHRVFSVLLKKYGGTIFDEFSKKSFTQYGKNEEIQLQKAFLENKIIFEKSFGKFTAAIRGDQVFEYIRNMKR